MGTTKFKVSALHSRLSKKKTPPQPIFPQLSCPSVLAGSIKVLFACLFQVQLYSEPDFQGRLVALEDSAAALDEDFIPRSCKVLAGR